MYTKIFAQIFDGTLCSKGPWQALVTFEQFLILADEDGIVDMTADAICRRTTIPLEIIELGISALLEPDPQSRNPAFEGRRLVSLSSERNWGWSIVNYLAYRNIRNEEERRESKRNWDRENRPTRSDASRQRPTRSDGARRKPTKPSHTDTKADSNAVSIKQKHINPKPSLGLPPSGVLTEVAARKTRGTRLEEIALPEPWRKFCKQERPDLQADAVFQTFRDHWIAKAGRDGIKLDWLAAWRNWVRRERAPSGHFADNRRVIQEWCDQAQGSGVIEGTSKRIGDETG